MSENCYPPSTILSEVIRELDPNAPPAAPLDLLSAVPLLFFQRREKLRLEKLARENVLLEAQYVAARAAGREKERKQQELEAEWERLQNIDLLPPVRVKDMTPCSDEVDALMDREIAKVVKGPGLKRTKSETEEQYDKRMTALELRLAKIQLVEVIRRFAAPPQYVEGFPTNLVNVHRHVRPIVPVFNAEMFDCLQCKVKGRRCSRNSEDSQRCERCRRDGHLCLIKRRAGKYDYIVRAWKFAEMPRRVALEDETRKWLRRLTRKGKVTGIQPLPAWPEKQYPNDTADQEDDTPRKWQDFLKGCAKRELK
ncbi:uncharacterized protein FTOL_05992 [Fusarium torulosum]|uniref:Uncharacterized protein n=1 Tax=Fusarium torulosum TaxID=33205 RepID=A0AAE8SHP8_9HYPO|nr:uncharacterized protein FTOL_05992 [Fusarium torulosum]